MNRLTYILLLGICMLSATARATCTQGDCQNGFGHYLWATGEKYVGNWINGKMFGYGVFYWIDGRKYIGEWREGKLHGQGTMFYADGKIKCGIWSNNQFVAMSRPDYQLSAENLKHGSNQIKLMLIDRPQMKGWITDGDTVWNWIARAFAGEQVRHRIYWQPTGTSTFVIPVGINAAHSYPTATHDGQLWVANLENPEEMWAGVVFELFNITNHKAFQAIENDAMRGLCNKEQYVMRYAELEYWAARRTAEFYKAVWKPYCVQKALKTKGQYWFVTIPDTFEDWISLYRDREGYPWHPYSEYYDRLVKSVVERY